MPTTSRLFGYILLSALACGCSSTQVTPGPRVEARGFKAGGRAPASAVDCTLIFAKEAYLPLQEFDRLLQEIYSRPEVLDSAGKPQKQASPTELRKLLNAAFGLDLPLIPLSVSQLGQEVPPKTGAYNAFTPLKNSVRGREAGFREPLKDEESSIFQNTPGPSAILPLFQPEHALSNGSDGSERYFLPQDVDLFRSKVDLLRRQLRIYGMLSPYGGPAVLGLGYLRVVDAQSREGLVVEEVKGEPLGAYIHDPDSDLSDLFAQFDHFVTNVLRRGVIPADLHPLNLIVEKGDDQRRLRPIDTSIINFLPGEEGGFHLTRPVTRTGEQMILNTLVTYVHLWQHSGPETQRLNPIDNFATKVLIGVLSPSTGSFWKERLSDFSHPAGQPSGTSRSP